MIALFNYFYLKIMNKIRVTNPHHFSKGVTVEIDTVTKKVTWTVDENEQRFKYGTIRTIPGEKTYTLNPEDSIEDFINLLTLAFEFTGCCYHGFKTEGGQIIDQEIIDAIYATPLEHDIKLVFLQTCGCNMGHCDAIVGINEPKESPKTYGEVMKILGDPSRNDQPLKYYEYPDSVWMILERIYNLPKIHKGNIASGDHWENNTCYSNEMVESDIKVDDSTIVLSFYYTR